jgi:beta-lactamase class A
MSDNTAGNALLKNIGGPAGLTSFARSLGDTMTRLDRIETELNEATPGDPRDTTTPNAMAANFRRLLLGDVLVPEGRDQLGKWLIANKTGDTRLRAGLPQGWRVGDKTGSGEHGTANDVAIVWPPERSPLIIAVYLTGASLDPNGRNDVIASVGREVGKAFG